MNPRANLYHYLAEALGDPPEWLTWPGKQWPLYESALELAHSSAAAREAVLQIGEIPAGSIASRRQKYQALVSGNGSKPQVWMYESLHECGRLAGPQMFAVEKAYRDAGLAPQSSELPDHASLELAFLAFLADGDPEADSHPAYPGPREKRFLRQHAGKWLPNLGKQLLSTQDRVYGPIGFLLASWLSESCQPKARPSALQSHLPALPEAESCTLCGFCAQVCPTQALVMRENAFTTGLALLPSACIHCGKCVKTCETGALHMAGSLHSRVDSKEWQTLMTSRRLACPWCNSPTISQAEMVYMESIIGRPDWLFLCLECRPKAMEKRA